MNSDSENESLESSIPEYSYLPGGLKAGINTTEKYIISIIKMMGIANEGGRIENTVF